MTQPCPHLKDSLLVLRTVAVIMSHYSIYSTFETECNCERRLSSEFDFIISGEETNQWAERRCVGDFGA